MTVSGRFVLLVAVGVLPLLAVGSGADGTVWWVLLGWLVFCALLGALDLAIAGSPRRVLITRDLPDRVRLGELGTSELVITNGGKRKISAVVRDGWQPSAGVIGTNRMPAQIPAGERRRLSQNLKPTRRGDRHSSRVTIRSAGPLGLWCRQASLKVPGVLRVLPPFNSRIHLPSRLTKLRELDGRTPIQLRGQGTEFDSIREYVRGDDVRSIDWRATARHTDPQVPGGARLMVRTWRPERDRRIVIVVDTSRTAAARVADEPRLDTGFESALLLAALATHAGDRIDFVAWDRRVRGQVHGVTGGELLTRMVNQMTTITAELLEPDWSRLAGHIRQLTSQRALVVILTAADSPGSARDLLQTLPQLTARHTVIVASVADPGELAAAGERENVYQVYRAAAAERALSDQARVAAAIRSLGAETVTASPLALPPALADKYLALKAAGRL